MKSFKAPSVANILLVILIVLVSIFLFYKIKEISINDTTSTVYTSIVDERFIETGETVYIASCLYMVVYDSTNNFVYLAGVYPSSGLTLLLTELNNPVTIDNYQLNFRKE